MKLLVIGCVLVSAYTQNLERQGTNQYFERTPNSNLVQIRYIGAQGTSLYDNRQSTNGQSYGNNNQFNNQRLSQSSQGGSQAFHNQRFQNEFNSQNQRLNQQNQRVSQSSQSFNLENQSFNQQNQGSQFSQQNSGFSRQTEPYSFNNYQFANPNLVEISFDENRQQQFLQNQERQRHQFQNQQNQRPDFQSQQRQQQLVQRQQQQRQQQAQLIQRQQQQRQQQQAQLVERQQQQRQQQQAQLVQRQQQQHQLAQRQNPFVSNNHGFQQSNFQNRINPAVPQRQQTGLIVHGNQHQSQRPSTVNYLQNQRIQNFQNQFQQGQRFPQTQMRLISGHLQRVDSDETVIGIFQPFSIPASASLYEGNLNSQFSCDSQGQGFFAEPLSNCQQFHVCTRVQGRNTPDLYRFTFQCVEGEYFDQAVLTCVRRAGSSGASCAAISNVQQRNQAGVNRALQLFGTYSATPYTPGTTPPGLCYLANNAHFVTGIRRK